MSTATASAATAAATGPATVSYTHLEITLLELAGLVAMQDRRAAAERTVAVTLGALGTRSLKRERL